MLIFVSHKLLSKPPRTSANWERCKEVECWSKQQIYTVDLLLYLQLPPSLQLSFSLSLSAIRLPAVLNPIKTLSLDAVIYHFPQKEKRRKRGERGGAWDHSRCTFPAPTSPKRLLSFWCFGKQREQHSCSVNESRCEPKNEIQKKGGAERVKPI